MKRVNHSTTRSNVPDPHSNVPDIEAGTRLWVAVPAAWSPWGLLVATSISWGHHLARYLRHLSWHLLVTRLWVAVPADTRETLLVAISIISIPWGRHLARHLRHLFRQFPATFAHVPILAVVILLHETVLVIVTAVWPPGASTIILHIERYIISAAI